MMRAAVRDIHERRSADVVRLRPSDESWERFISAEYRNLFARQRGQLRLALGAPLPDEFEEEIEWMAREDQRRAEEGLVELKGSGGTHYKRIEDLTLTDAAKRRAAETERSEWLMGRMEERTRLIRKDWDEAI